MEGCQIFAAGNPYADENGAFGDNQFRYALLSLAACEAPLQLHVGGYRYRIIMHIGVPLFLAIHLIVL